MDNEKGLTGIEKCHALFSVFFMAAFYGMIPLGLEVDPNIMWSMIGIWFIYLCHASCQ